MWNKLIVFLGLCLATNRSKAQMDIQMGWGTLGNGANSYPTPIQDGYEGSRIQFLYRAADLNSFGLTKGIISAMKFYINYDPNPAGLVEQFTIKIGTTSATVMPQTTWLAGTTTVFGPIDYQPTFYINTFSFSTPFNWNGTDNIVLEFCNGDPNNASANTYSYNTRVDLTAIPYVCGHTTVASNMGNLCGTNNTTQFGENYLRPNVIFTWKSTDSCLPVNVPYLQNFETAPSPEVPVCTSRENIGTNNVWFVENSTNNPSFSSKTLESVNITNSPANAWFYTRGINLTGGTAYNLSFRYGTRNPLQTTSEKLNVFYGSAPTANSMANLIVDYPSINNYNSANSSTDFTPTSSGVYYIGFHAYSNPSTGSNLVDDIVVSASTTTPVKLISFTGKAKGNANILQWQTATETNNEGFVLQRSANGLQFSNLAFVPTKAANGNSSLTLSYNFTDNNPYAAITYYRLQQKDNDGKYNYTNIVAIKGTSNSEVVVTHVFPNPAKDRLQVTIQSPTTQTVTMLLTDLSGKVVLQQKTTLLNGNNNTFINIASISSGVYMLKVVCNNGCVSAVEKVVVGG